MVRVLNSKITRLEMAESTGGSFTGLTVNRNEVLLVPTPSVTEIFTVVEPLAFGTGVKLTVRFEPLPPNTMFGKGSKAVLVVNPLTDNEAADVSKSPITKPMAAVELSSATVWFAMLEIAGTRLTVTDAAELLLALTGSLELLVTEQVFVKTPLVRHLAVTVSVMFAALLIGPAFSVNTLPLVDHVPWLAAADTKLNADGSVLVTNTSLAILNPKLVIVMLNVTLLARLAIGGETDWLTPASAVV